MAANTISAESLEGSNPEENDGQQQDADATTSKGSGNAGRLIRRRARKACIECHKRFVATNSPVHTVDQLLTDPWLEKFDVMS